MFTHIKKGQHTVSELIKSDIPHDTTTIYALNSGKRFRALIVGAVPDISTKQQLAIEYIHTGVSIMHDILNGYEHRRRLSSVHIKWGITVAQQVSNRLIFRGLGYLKDASSAVAQQLEAITLSLTEVKDVPVRESIARIGSIGLFGVTFLIAYGPEARQVGESLGVCYYLCTRNIPGMTHNETIDLFTDKMQFTVEHLTTMKLWSPVLREIVSYIMHKFKKRTGDLSG